MALNPRQHQLRPQAADRGRAEREAAAVERGQIGDDGQAEAGARLGLIQPLAAARHLRPLGR